MSVLLETILASAFIFSLALITVGKEKRGLEEVFMDFMFFTVTRKILLYMQSNIE